MRPDPDGSSAEGETERICDMVIAGRARFGVNRHSQSTFRGAAVPGLAPLFVWGVQAAAGLSMKASRSEWR